MKKCVFFLAIAAISVSLFCGHAVFKVNDEIKFMIDEDYWVNVNFNDLQEFMFGTEGGEYHLLEGTYSGEYLEEEI